MLPAFETERLFLRPRTMAELDACLAMDRDPEVTKYVAGPWSNPVEHRRFVVSRIEARFAPGLGYWSIFAKAQPEQFLGWVLLIPDDGTGPDIEIGWRLNRHAWGKGYATEATHPLLGHAFLSLGIDRVIAGIHPDNAASIHVAEKIGLKSEHDPAEGETPYKTYVINRLDFLAARAISA